MGKCDKMGLQIKHTFVFKAIWPSTMKLIKVEASDEDVAFDKAFKLKELKGCLQLKLMRQTS